MDGVRTAVVGVGRIGSFHARHLAELAARDGSGRLAALVDPRPDLPSLAARLGRLQGEAPAVFASLDDYFEAGPADAAVVASPTALHREHAQRLIAEGHRVLVEKPLTDGLEQDREFAAELDELHPDALMLAFQRRFDDALVYVKESLDAGRIGRPFKYVSVLEDSLPMPSGYESPGLLQDMSVHNVDEVLWLSGQLPSRTLATGSRLYSQHTSSVYEDFDDAQLLLDLADGSLAQIQVGRNHVAGYRVETWVFGEEGVIHAGGFQQEPREVRVEAYGRSGPIEARRFATRDYGVPVPEFIDRFGDAYAAELRVFIGHCREGTPFPIDQGDGLRAMEVVAAGAESLRSGSR